MEASPDAEPGAVPTVLIDRSGQSYSYSCNRPLGVALSFGIGFHSRVCSV